jgi:hypothetical protein
MSKLLGEGNGEEESEVFGVGSLCIRGEVYTNTAAKFWSSLIDEIIHDFPACDLLTVAAAGSAPLSRALLHPEHSLERDWHDLANCRLEDIIREAVVELEMFGPATGVTLALFSGDKELTRQQLPNVCVDATSFAYLLAWLLEWAGISEDRWNNDSARGRIVADDWERDLRYRTDIEFCNEHLSEGLYLRTARLKVDRRPRRGESG